MTNGFDEMILNMTDTTPEPEDYTGEDGLLYCGKCHKPKEGYFPKETAAWLGRDRHPAECDCQRAEREEREAAEKQRSHLETVERLKRRGFTDPAMQGWTFENDNGKCPQMEHAHFYVENWETMKERNIGYLLWGGVGTGKSYFAGCIANALMEREIPVCMTNFALILGDLAASFEGRNEYISRLCSFPLLKSIFRSAMESRIIDHNPTIHLTTKGGGVPQEDRQALTDEQVERLLDAIRGLPPYVFVMIGLYAGLRREEILALQWDSVYLDTDTPYLTVRRAWHTEHNRPVILEELKTKAAERNIPLPVCLAECLKAAKATSTSEYVVSNRDGEPLSYTQFKRLWQYIVTRTVKERSYYRYEDGKRVKHTVTPVLGEKAAHNGKVVYSLDFEVTPHQLRHTYITNLIHASVDPKTVQYLAGHESSKITMDIYAKVKYNRPDELVRSMSGAFAGWEAV